MPTIGWGCGVVAELKPLLAGRPDIEVDEDYWGGLRLMERMVGFDRAVVIDAICTDAPPGTIHRLTPNAIPTQKSNSAHDMTLPTAWPWGARSTPICPRTRTSA